MKSRTTIENVHRFHPTKQVILPWQTLEARKGLDRQGPAHDRHSGSLETVRGVRISSNLPDHPHASHPVYSKEVEDRP